MDPLCIYTKHWFLSWLIVILVLSMIIGFAVPIKRNLGSEELMESSKKNAEIQSSVLGIYTILHLIVVLMNKDKCEQQRNAEYIKQVKKEVDLMKQVSS